MDKQKNQEKINKLKNKIDKQRKQKRQMKKKENDKCKKLKINWQAIQFDQSKSKKK